VEERAQRGGVALVVPRPARPHPVASWSIARCSGAPSSWSRTRCSSSTRSSATPSCVTTAKASKQANAAALLARRPTVLGSSERARFRAAVELHRARVDIPERTWHDRCFAARVRDLRQLEPDLGTHAGPVGRVARAPLRAGGVSYRDAAAKDRRSDTCAAEGSQTTHPRSEDLPTTAFHNRRSTGASRLRTNSVRRRAGATPGLSRKSRTVSTSCAGCS
jgi:hypothetical protein